MLKLMYTLFLGLLLTVFVGLGVSAFYQQPASPAQPEILQRPLGPDQTFTPEQRTAQYAWEHEQAAYSDRVDDYNRNVSMIVLAFAVLFVVLGLTLHSRIGALADGLLVGGIVTLLYSVLRSLSADNARFSFVVVSVGLAVTLTLGYFKFIQPAGAAAGKKRRKWD